jgi:large subunit ribosomal protein L2
MGLKSYKPTSAAMRTKTVSDFKELTDNNKEKKLIVSFKRTGGRNNQGTLTARHRGGGHRKKYRIIDFKRDLDGVPGKVISIQYDPNRSSRIALIQYLNGEKRYIIAPNNLKLGQIINSGANAEIRDGNSLPLKNIPTGTFIHNIELYAGRGAQLVRSAGAYAQILAFDKGYAHVKLPSGELRLINENCKATMGQVGNLDNENITLGTAGRVRHMGWRPHVRGVAMNPVDHPLGGGEGKSSGGRHPCSPWGQIAKGLKTRNNKATDRFIIKRRK